MSKLRAPSRKDVDRVAKAIKFMVPLNGYDVNCKNDPHTKILDLGWTAKGLKDVKWPKGFTAVERKLIRAIARRALTTGLE